MQPNNTNRASTVSGTVVISAANIFGAPTMSATVVISAINTFGL